MVDIKVEPRNYRLIHIVFIILIAIMSYVSGGYKVIIGDLQSSAFMISFFFLSLFIYWGLNSKYDNIRFATQRAVFSFITAYLAHLDMVFVAFMVAWMFVFHAGEKWV